MNRVWESDSQVTPPATPGSFSTGYPTDGNLLTSVPPTNPGAWWYHMITEEIRNVIGAAGLTPNGASITQLLAALEVLYGSGSGGLHLSDFTGARQSLAASGYQKLPGGLIIQWGSVHVGDLTGGAWTPVSPTFPIAFPTACRVVIPVAVDALFASSGFISSNSASQSASGFTTYLGESSAWAQDVTLFYLAIGY